MAAEQRGSRRTKKAAARGMAYVQSTFNNTIVTITDGEGNTFGWSSAGTVGFKGTKKGTPFAELGLGDERLTDDQLLDAMIEHPILIERPLVASPRGVKLCRPSEAVLDLLPPLPTPFTKEDGEQVG